MNRGTSTEHIATVIAIEDRVLRNYWVTQTYSDLTIALANLMSPDTANWHSFGTWASFTVGGNMRGDAMPSWLQDHVVLPDHLMGSVSAAAASHGPRHILAELSPEHLFDVLRGLLGQMAINLSDGNTEVFAEITPPAAEFLSVYSDPSINRATARQRVLKACHGVTEFEGVNHLAAGYSLWCDSMDEVDPVRKSQQILAGSINLGVHEQNHLQPQIAASMDLGVNQSASRLKERLTSGRDLDADVAQELDEGLAPVAHGIGDVWDTIMTLAYGTLESPDGTLLLDHDVPPPSTGTFAPPELATIVIDDLAALKTRFDRSRGDGSHTAAANWVNFDERMNYIANLFISRHHDAQLLQPPFDDATLALIMSDQIPPEPTRGSSK